MTGRVQREIKPRKPFHRVEDEAFVNIQRTADALMQGLATALKPTGLSPTQYNVLRILRGAEPDGLACREIADRMITRDPDITRLLDRMENHGWITRQRQQEDPPNIACTRDLQSSLYYSAFQDHANCGQRKGGDED